MGNFSPENLFVLGYFISLAILIFIVIYSYVLHKKESKWRQQDIQVHLKAQSIIEHAHKKAQDILDQTEEKAKQILAGTEAFRVALEKEYKKDFEAVLDKNMQYLQKSSESFADNYISLFSKLKEQHFAKAQETLIRLKKESDGSLDGFRKKLEDEFEESQNLVRLKTVDQIVTAQKEVQDYKQEQLKNFDAAFNSALRKLSEEVLGKVIPIQDHQELIMRALENAKREGLFTL